MRRKKNKKKKFFNIFFSIIGIISMVIAILFEINIIRLDMLPSKYLIIVTVILGLVYLILLLLTMIRSVKLKIKTVCFILFVLFDLIFFFGIKYSDKTINFLGKINEELTQSEIYYLVTKKDSKLNSINDFNNKDIGIYTKGNTDNLDKALDDLSDKIAFKEVKFDSTEMLFNSLINDKTDGLFINEAIRNHLNTDLSDLNLELKEIYKVTISSEKVDIKKSVDVTKEVFNIYIAGGDSYGTIESITNTDVNMIVTVDPINRKILLTSIPRDYYVNLPSFGDDAYDKLTHAGYYGIDESVKAIEKLLDIEINYYVKVNFSTIEGVIDAIKGVDVYSDYNFCANGRSDICYKKGNIHLDGFYSLMFARERYAFKDGDVQRVKNQQKVLTAIINKVTKSTALITNYTDILDSVSESFSTNLDTKSINKLVRMQLSNMSGWDIESQNLIGTDLYTKNTYTFPEFNLYVMKQDENSVSSAKEKISEYFNK